MARICPIRAYQVLLPLVLPTRGWMLLPLMLLPL